MTINLTPKLERIPYANVNEIFGPTIQGEGSHTGQRVAFLRLAGCNLSCVWCDTPYSWDWERYDRSEESHRMTIDAIAETIKPMGVNRIVVTGGEPMIQQNLFSLIQAATGCKLDIETNGTRMPSQDAIDAVDLFCVSPKLAHAGDPEAQRLKPDVLKKFSELAKEGKALFKFVAQDVSDFDEIKLFIEAGNISSDSVWIMPEGADPAKQIINTQKLTEAIIGEGWNLSARLHVLIWGTERGH
jgi:7-cyano-7-deazaguanosine (preQ0) biosynthesis protein QueE